MLAFSGQERAGSSEAFYSGFFVCWSDSTKVKNPWLIATKNKRKETVMMTLRQFSAEPSTIPTITSWYLADLSKAQGKQELFTHQSPQKLKILREHALIESAISSNRIEGINVDQSRINTLILGKPVLKDRNEEEVRGYCDALRLIHEKAAGELHN